MSPKLTMQFINVDLGKTEDHASYLALRDRLDQFLARFHGVKRLHLSASSLKSPLLLEFARYYKARGFGLFLVSNAFFLEGVDRKRLAQVPLDVLGFWVESSHRDIQEKIRPGEDVKTVLEAFDELKKEHISFETAFYTNLLEENHFEVIRLLEFVSHHHLVDRLFLQLLGEDTPEEIQEFRDAQQDFQGKPVSTLRPDFFQKILEEDRYQKVLLNPLSQLEFFALYFNSPGGKYFKESLGQIPCCNNEVFLYLGPGNEVHYHCPSLNEDNVYLLDTEFKDVLAKVERCKARCHFKLNYQTARNQEHNFSLGGVGVI